MFIDQGQHEKEAQARRRCRPTRHLPRGGNPDIINQLKFRTPEFSTQAGRPGYLDLVAQASGLYSQLLTEARKGFHLYPLSPSRERGKGEGEFNLFSAPINTQCKT